MLLLKSYIGRLGFEPGLRRIRCVPVADCDRKRWSLAGAEAAKRTKVFMKSVVIVGAGPAGLAAAEVLSAAGVSVQVYDAMASVGRKFLLAGIGGLNLTHAEAKPGFLSRYGYKASQVSPWLEEFDADAIRDWASGLGIDTFVGSSQRVFPKDMKAAPLLRAWLHRLRHPEQGTPVAFHMRHRWVGWDTAQSSQHVLRFDTPQGPQVVSADRVLLALGGASWARLGSDGAWVPTLTNRSVPVCPLKPANCGFDVGASGLHHEGEGWSPALREKHEGAPLKGVVLKFAGFERKGECVLTRTGVEGSLVYAASALIRDAIERDGSATIHLDLMPDRSTDDVLAQVAYPRGAKSMVMHLRSRLRLDGVKLALVLEVLERAAWADAKQLAQTIKHLPLTLVRPRPLDEAISTAGGVDFAGMTKGLELSAVPGVWCAGEMLDWEAPTGGYLLTACMASGRYAAKAMLADMK